MTDTTSGHLTVPVSIRETEPELTQLLIATRWTQEHLTEAFWLDEVIPVDMWSAIQAYELKLRGRPTNAGREQAWVENPYLVFQMVMPSGKTQWFITSLSYNN